MTAHPAPDIGSTPQPTLTPDQIRALTGMRDWAIIRAGRARRPRPGPPRTEAEATGSQAAADPPPRDHRPVTRRMYRYEIPVDDSWHTLTLHGPIRHVASRSHGVAQAWAQHDTDQAYPVAQSLIVVGTGHPWPEDDSTTRVEWVGTTLAPHGLVWHVLRRVDDHLDDA